jgi:hypothetical protein
LAGLTSGIARPRDATERWKPRDQAADRREAAGSSTVREAQQDRQRAAIDRLRAGHDRDASAATEPTFWRRKGTSPRERHETVPRVDAIAQAGPDPERA